MTIKQGIMNFFETRGKGRPPKGGYSVETLDTHAYEAAIQEDSQNGGKFNQSSTRRALQELVAAGKLVRVSRGHYNLA